MKTIGLEPLAMFRFRAITSWDEQYKIWVSQCLETGSIVTADDPDTAESMIAELLEDEVKYHLKSTQIANLFSAPAKLELWQSWKYCPPHLAKKIEECGEVLAELDIRRKG